jgi:glycosyltransferase involved in cell wall biosynthesis
MAIINVLHLMNTFSDSSISRIVLRLVESMDMKDIRWHVGALSDPGVIKEEFIRIGAQGIDFSENGKNNSRIMMNDVRKYVLTNHIRIIHTHTPRTIFTGYSALSGLSNISHLGTKHLLTKSGDRKWGLIFSTLDRLSLYFPDVLIPVSQAMYRQIVKQPGIQPSHVNMIRNAIPNEHFYLPSQRDSCRKELGLPTNAIVLGYTGRIQQVKRLDILLDAFIQIVGLYPEAWLVICGEGEARPQLEESAIRSGISDKIIWTGFRQDIPRLLSAMDIYIQTSSNEGLSLSILEAMAAGKPVIATDAGGNSEMIDHERNGLLIKNCSITEIVKSISLLIEKPGYREQLGMSALKLVQNDFSLNKMVKNYQNLYERVLSVGNRKG